MIATAALVALMTASGLCCAQVVVLLALMRRNLALAFGGFCVFGVLSSLGYIVFGLLVHDAFPVVLDTVMVGFYIYVWDKFQRRRGKKNMLSLIGAKTRAIRNRVVASMPTARPVKPQVV